MACANVQKGSGGCMECRWPASRPTFRNRTRAGEAGRPGGRPRHPNALWVSRRMRQTHTAWREGRFALVLEGPGGRLRDFTQGSSLCVRACVLHVCVCVCMLCVYTCVTIKNIFPIVPQASVDKSRQCFCTVSLCFQQCSRSCEFAQNRHNRVMSVADAEDPEADRSRAPGNSQSLGNKSTREALWEMRAQRWSAGMDATKLLPGACVAGLLDAKRPSPPAHRRHSVT